MTSSSRAALLVAAVISMTSAATVQRTQSSAGGSSYNGVSTSFNSIGTRGGFNTRTPSGGSAFMSSSTVNGRPVSFSSFTTGTGTNRFNSFNTGALGNRGGFNRGQYRPSVPVVPFRPVVVPNIPYGGQTAFNRFGGSGYGQGSVSSFSSSSSSAGLDVNGYINAIAANINRNLQASLGRR